MDWTGYADDLLISFEKASDAEPAIKILDEIFTSYQLKINVGKTKSMVFNFNEDSDYPKSIIQLHNEPIENVVTFRYLGNEIHYAQPETGDAEVRLRMRLAEGQFSKYRSKFTNNKINLSTRVLLFNSLVRSRLIYGCQTWTLRKRQKDQLDSFYCSRLRRLVRNGFGRKDKKNKENYTLKYTNDDILKICHCEKLSDFTFRLQIAYLGHIIRTPHSNPAKQLLFNDNKYKGRHPDTLEQQVVKRLVSETPISDREDFFRRCLAKTEHQLFPKPEKTKRKNLTRDHSQRKKTEKKHNNKKSVRGKAE